MDRAHTKLVEFLGTTMNESNQDLGLGSLCYNQTIYNATGYSPHELLFGIKPNVLKVPKVKEITTDRVGVIRNHLGNIRKNGVKNDLKKKKNSNERKRFQLVLAKNLAIPNNKLEPKWIGPYKIM